MLDQGLEIIVDGVAGPHDVVTCADNTTSTAVVGMSMQHDRQQQTKQLCKWCCNYIPSWLSVHCLVHISAVELSLGHTGRPTA